MILSAILLFGLAVAFGLSLIVLGVRYHRGSPALGLSHAGIASLALSLLVIQIFRDHTRLLYNDAALLFFLALAGGIVLLAVREGRKPPPMVVVGMHAAMALVAFFLLVKGYALG
ncbi:MAG: hypothetical protein P8076_05480 [Gammaproteobacteria bacterium]